MRTEFNDILLTNAEFLKPFAITLTKDNETANDLLQETLYKALVNKEKYNAGTNIKAWLYTIMRNAFINNYRRHSKQKIIFTDTTREILFGNYGKDIIDNVTASLHLKDLMKMIYQLPAIFRNPFMLYVDGYKYHEIAEMLREPLGTVKSRIHFARKMLRTRIERD